MYQRSALVIVFAVALLSSGCGTMTNLKQPVLPPAGNPDAQVCRIYGGLRSDFSSVIHYPWAKTPEYIDYVILPVMVTVDLGFTLVGDTLTLPYPIYAETRRGIQRWLHGSETAPEPPPLPSEEKERARQATQAAQAGQILQPPVDPAGEQKPANGSSSQGNGGIPQR